MRNVRSTMHPSGAERVRRVVPCYQLARRPAITVVLSESVTNRSKSVASGFGVMCQESETSQSRGERYRRLTTVIRASVFLSGPPDSKGLSPLLADNQDNQNSGDHYEQPNPASNPDHLRNVLLQQLPELAWEKSHAVYACRPTIRAARPRSPGVIGLSPSSAVALSVPTASL